MEFSKDIQEFLVEKFPDVDIESLSLEELKAFKEEVNIVRNEYSLLELAMKTLGNAAYGASANHGFYFYNVKLAGDITGECRHLTKTMNENLIEWFHEGIWKRKDLWEKFDFALDESKHDWYRKQDVWIYSDTDSIFSNSVLLIKRNNKPYLVTIEQLFHNCYLNNGVFAYDASGKEVAPSNDEVLNWSKEKGLYFAPIKYVMKHNVSKAKYKIKSESNKEIIVTGDHSCIVFRNGEQLVVKACEINKDMDELLSLDDDFYVFEEIESIEQLEDFNNEDVYDIEVDDETHTFIANDILVHNSSYVTYGAFFKAMTPEYQKKYESDEAKVQWILKYNQEFQNNLNNQWCEELYAPRHGKNIHNFELETISRAGIYLKKKKYLKGLVFNKGKFLKEPKISGTGIEIIKSTTPKMCRDILKDLMKSLMFDFDESSTESRNRFIEEFSEKLANYRRQFIKAPYEEISQSIGIGDYNKFVIDDTNFLVLGKGCPVSVHAIARYNYMAHRNGEDNKRIYAGKIKYYNIAISKGKDKTGYFGFPAGELPEWAPEMDKYTQWQKNVIDPINRFLEVMKIPLVNASNVVQLDLFGGNDDLFG